LIIVDDRKETVTFDGLTKKGLHVEVQRIEIADVLLDGGVAIERKGHDLISSLTSKRIWEQLNNLCEYEKPIICIINENLWRDFYFCHSRWIHSSYRGFLTTLAISYPKLKVFQFTSMDDYIDFIVALDKKIHDEGSSERPKMLARKPIKLSDSQENVIAGVPGISIKTAKLLLNSMGNVKSIANATKEELMDIPNIGEKTASEIVKVMGSEYGN
jgi:ERCC4-type nuclease